MSLSPPPPSPQSICILRLSAVGDICHTIPVVRTLMQHFPNARITWIIGKLEATLVGDIPNIEFIIFDKSKGLTAYKDLYKRLKGRRFDVLLAMQVALRASIASLFIKAPIKIGFDKARARDSQTLFTNQQIQPARHEHVMEGLFGFAQKLGINTPLMQWDIPLPEAAHQFADHYITPDQKTLIISPCSSSRVRNWRHWHSEGYAAVADHAIKHHGMQVILTGGPSDIEKEYGEAITQQAHHPLINLISKTNLKQLLALLNKSTVLISPDSGPAHMANTLGLPVIGLYVTSNPARTGPYHQRQWTVNKYPEALEHYLHKKESEVRWGTRVRDPDAMSLIKDQDVIDKLDALMGEAELK